MLENILQVTQLEVRRDGKLFRTLAGVMGFDEPDAHAVIWPCDPCFYAADGALDPDGVYEIDPDQPAAGVFRVVDLDAPGKTVVLALAIQ